MEWIATYLFLLVSAGAYFPLTSASIGLAIFLVRIWYSSAYVLQGPKWRVIPFIINILLRVVLGVISIVSGVKHITNQWSYYYWFFNINKNQQLHFYFILVMIGRYDYTLNSIPSFITFLFFLIKWEFKVIVKETSYTSFFTNLNLYILFFICSAKSSNISCTPSLFFALV